MTQYTVLKYKFYTPLSEKPHRLEFIVSYRDKFVSEKLLRKSVERVLYHITLGKPKIRDGIPEHDFGDLSWTEVVDDIKKLLILDKLERKNMKIHIWFDRDEEISLWDET